MAAPRKRRSVSKQLTTSTQDIYVAPPRFEADIVTIFISNISSASATITLQIYNAEGATTFVILQSVVIAANSILQISDPFYLLVNDKIQGLASVNSALNVTVTVNEENKGAL